MRGKRKIARPPIPIPIAAATANPTQPSAGGLTTSAATRNRATIYAPTGAAIKSK
jgi:hypothetical protein